MSGQKVKDLHRPYIDEITFEKDGKVYKRREEVLDSWFEAGSMPYAQIHYPFENQEKFEKNFPGDYIVEYIAQVRAWFNVMHRLSVALFDTNSFKNVISTGVMAGNDGRKMSKTYGNYTDPKDVLENIGGDALRLYLMNSPLMVGANANFDDKELKTKLNNVLNPLWNSLKFFVMYANQNEWTPKKLVDSDHTLDIWIKARLEEATQGFVRNIENYNVPPAVQFLEDFVDDLSRWYVRRSRDRITSGDNAALSTLYDVLAKFSKVAAPAIPFMTENIYQHLTFAKDSTESVHLCDYPSFDAELIEHNQPLIRKMKNTRDLVSLALSIRSENKLKVRQPLSTLYVVQKPEAVEEKLEFDQDLIKAEVNVKEVVSFEEKSRSELSKYEMAENTTFEVYLDTKITKELEIEGAARELIRTLQDLRKKAKLDVSDRVEFEYVENDLNEKAIKKYSDMIMSKVGATKLKASSEYKIKK